MSNLPIISPLGELAAGRAQRQASREISRIQAHGAALTARENARVEVVASVTETALLATSHLSAIEALLVQRTPHAEARLRHIADAGCTGMASIVLSLSRRV